MLKLEHMTRCYKTKGRIVNAIDDISLEVSTILWISVVMQCVAVVLASRLIPDS